MKYEPWDKLQLNGSIAGGQRVRKNEVFYKLYRSYGQKIVWSPLFLSNGAVFYGEDETEVITLVENLSNQNKKTFQSSAIHFYDFTGKWKEKLEVYETSLTGFYYHPFKDSLEEFINSLFEHFEMIKVKMREGSLSEPVNKKLDLILIEISKEQLKELKKNEPLSDKLIAILTHGYKFRIYPMIISEKILGFSPELVKSLEWITFLGTNNINISERLFAKLESGFRSINQKVIGTCYNSNNSNILPIHPLKFTPSEWWLSKQKRLETEDYEYSKYLATLKDGT